MFQKDMILQNIYVPNIILKLHIVKQDYYLNSMNFRRTFPQDPNIDIYVSLYFISTIKEYGISHFPICRFNQEFL